MSKCCVDGVPFLPNCKAENGYKVYKVRKNGFGGTYSDEVYADVTISLRNATEAKEAYGFLNDNKCYFTINLPLWGEIDFVEVKMLNFDELERSNFRGGTSSIQLKLELLSDENTRYITDLNGDYIVFNNKLVREQE